MADHEENLIPTIRHFENRRGEGPGDDVGSCICTTARTTLLSLVATINVQKGEPTPGERLREGTYLIGGGGPGL